MWCGFISGLMLCAEASSGSSENIHAVIVSSSRYWFNYRHAMNALGIYEILKQNGVPDSQIILMIADEYATNSRNPFKNGMYANGVRPENTWYTEDTELDYRGSDVTVKSFLDATLGTGPKSLQATNEDSNLLIFVTGHGGDQFFKFQDEKELTAQDIANLMEELARRKKFKKALFIADTCQAFTLFNKVTTPNVYALGTSLRNENAYAHHSDYDLGLAVIERWTHGFLTNYRKRKEHPATTTLHDIMVAPFEGKGPLGAHIGVLGDFRQVRISEFLGKKSSGRAKPAVKESLPILPATTSNRGIGPAPIRHFQSGACAATAISEGNATMTRLSDESPEPNDTAFLVLVSGLVLLVVLSSKIVKTTNNDSKRSQATTTA